MTVRCAAMPRLCLAIMAAVQMMSCRAVRDAHQGLVQDPKPCLDNACATCSVSRDLCEKCKTAQGFKETPASDGTCTCAEGKQREDNSCKDCEEINGCAKLDADCKCAQCKNGYEKAGDGCKCPGGFRDSKTEGCLTCNRGNLGNCLECNEADYNNEKCTRCQDGYKPDNSRRHCDRVQCKIPKDKVLPEGVEAEVYFGETVTVGCDTHKHFKGTTITLTCLKSGEFSGNEPCECQEKFKLDGGVCKVDEAAVCKGICTNGQCSASEGGAASCECNKGYKPDEKDPLKCVKRSDEEMESILCEEKHCESGCKVDNGNAKCTCQAGYKLAGETACQNINECEEEEKPCPAKSTCYDNEGGYTCKCDKGYEGDQCVDRNECLESPPRCEQTCKNTDGGYECSCDDYNTLGPDGSSCEPLEKPCAGNPCGENQLCTPYSALKPHEQTSDKYRCDCIRGYEAHPYSGRCEKCLYKAHYCESICSSMFSLDWLAQCKQKCNRGHTPGEGWHPMHRKLTKLCNKNTSIYRGCVFADIVDAKTSPSCELKPSDVCAEVCDIVGTKYAIIGTWLCKVKCKLYYSWVGPTIDEYCEHGC